MNITTNTTNQNFGVSPTAPILNIYRNAIKENPRKAKLLIEEMSNVYGSKILVPLKRKPNIYEKRKNNNLTEIVDLYVGRKKKASVVNLSKEGVSATAKLRYILKKLKNAEIKDGSKNKILRKWRKD